MNFDLELLAPEVAQGIRLVPILHERVDFAAVVRAALDTVQPATVAVELPTTLTEVATRAVARLPAISLVVAEEPGQEALLWVVAPGDPLVEALRWAIEHRRRVVLVDPDVSYRGRHHDPLPDPHLIHHLGVDSVADLVRRAAAELPHDDGDRLRERGMAHHLQYARSRGDGDLLCMVGAAHARRLADLLTGPTAPPLARQSRSRILLRHLDPESLTAVLPDPPLAHAAWELLRGGRPPTCPSFDDTVARRIEVPVGPLTVITGGAAEGLRERRQALAEFAASRAASRSPVLAVDRAALGGIIWRVGAASHREQTRTATQPWQQRLFFEFARRYSRVQGRLTAGLYEWVVAARGVADDNLAWEVFDAARCYPWQADHAEIESARIDGDMLDLGTRQVRFRRRFPRVKQRPIPVRSRAVTGEPGEWLEGFNSDGICSYPPEDLVVEDWGRHLKRRAVSVLSAEQTHSEPFTTSLLDGIDLRETLLHHHEGRIWVREHGREPGAAGSVVMIFDSDRDGSSFPYLMTWLGEHDQESDMALYATDPLQQVVGPGIMRATYGGFLLTFPPGRLYDVWRDPDYRLARNKPETLTMAAVDYSVDPLVVHVAPSPPSPRMRDYAGSRGRRLVHLPLGGLSPVSVARVRVVHILVGREKREIAQRYVW